MKTSKIIGFLLLLLSAIGLSRGALVPIDLAWDDADPTIVSFTVKVGTKSGEYTQAFPVTAAAPGAALPREVRINLEEGRAYFAVVTASTTDYESDPSVELPFTVGRKPAPPTNLKKVNLKLAVSGSADLKVWNQVATLDVGSDEPNAFFKLGIVDPESVETLFPLPAGGKPMVAPAPAKAKAKKR